MKSPFMKFCCKKQFSNKIVFVSLLLLLLSFQFCFGFANWRPPISISHNSRLSEINKSSSPLIFNSTTFFLLYNETSNQSEYDQIRDILSFDFLGLGRKQIAIISTIWNTSQNHQGKIQLLDYDLKNPDELNLLDSITLTNGTGDLELLDLAIYDIDMDNTSEIIVTGGINSQGWAFLKVYNFTAGTLNFEFEEWWYSSYGIRNVYYNDILFADFDNDSVNEVATLTTVVNNWEDQQNIFRFWNVSNNNLLLENQFGFQTGNLEPHWSYDDNLWAIDLDEDNYTEILLLAARNAPSSGDSMRLFLLNYTGSSLNQEVVKIWTHSDIGPGDMGLQLGDFDADGELEILAKYQQRLALDEERGYYNMFNFSGKQFNEEFAGTYWHTGAGSQRPGQWVAIELDEDNETEFISTDYYENNNTALLRIWNYVGGILITSEIKQISTTNTNQPAYFCFIGDDFPLFICYPQIDVVGYDQHISIYMSDQTPPTVNSPAGMEYATNSTNNYTRWILSDNALGGYFHILINGTPYINETAWIPGINLTIPIDTNRDPGVWNYSIQYNDSVGLWGQPGSVMITLIDNESPTVSSPASDSYLYGAIANQAWLLNDNIAGGYYQILINDTYYTGWTPWISGEDFLIPIDTFRGIGQWNYSIYYNDSKGLWGQVSSVIVNIYETQPPSSINPSGATYQEGQTGASINWILSDNVAGGYYQVLINNSEHVPWTRWESGVNLLVPIDTNCGIGMWNYTLQFNDSAGFYGTPSSIMIVITEKTITGRSLTETLIPLTILITGIAISAAIILHALYHRQVAPSKPSIIPKKSSDSPLKK